MTDTAAAQNLFFRVREPGVPERILVFDTQELTIGRAKENDLRADYPEMSRKHARLVRGPAGLEVRNLSKSNGTLVNEAVVDEHVLASGDVIRIAELELEFCVSAERPATSDGEIKYASELKGFGTIATGGSAENTMLGLVDEVETTDDTFEIDHVDRFEAGVSAGELDAGLPPEPRNLDLDLQMEGFGLVDLDAPETDSKTDSKTTASGPPTLDSPPPLTQPAPIQPADERAKTAPPLEDRGLEGLSGDVWTLDDDSQETLAPELELDAESELLDADELEAGDLDAGALEADEFEAEAELEPVPDTGTLSLHLELQGLTPELRRTVESLFGKVIALPALQIRIKDDDLD